jgi:hypothetical protein
LSRRAKLLRLLLVVFLVVSGATTGGVMWFQRDGGQEWVRAMVVQQVQNIMGEGEFQIGDLSTDQWGVLELEDVVLTDEVGREVVHLDRVRLGYGIEDRTLVVSELSVLGGNADLRLDEDGVLDIQRLFPPGTEDSPPPEVPIPVVLEAITVADVDWAYSDVGKTLASGDVHLTATGRGEGTLWTISGLEGRGTLTEPTLGPYAFEGDVAYDLVGRADLLGVQVLVADSEVLLEGQVFIEDEPRLELTVDATADLDGLERMTGDVGLKGRPNVEVGISGPLSAMAVEGRVLLPSGNAGIAVVVGVGESITYEGTVTPKDIELMEVLDAVSEPTTLSGELELNGAGVEWPDDLTATGTVLLSDSVGWGYALPEAQATWELEGGVITLTGFRYTADWCEVTGDGHLTETTMDVDIVAACSDLRGLAEFQVPDAHGAARVTGRVLADWSAAVTVDFDGYVVGYRVGYADYAVMSRYEGPVSADWDDTSGATAVGTRSSIEGIDSYGAFIPTAQAGWEAIYTLDGTTTWRAEFAGQDAVYLDGTLKEATGLTTGTLGGDGSLVADVELDLVSPVYERFDAGWGDATIHVVDTQLAVVADLYDGDEEVLHLDGGGDYEVGRYRFTDVRVGPETGVQWASSRPVEVLLTEFGVAELDVDFKSAAGRVEALGTLATEGPVEALVHAEGFQVAYLAGVFPEYGTYVGMVDADLAITGRADAVELDGIVRATSVMVPGQVWGLSAVIEVDTAPGEVLLEGRLDDMEGHLLAFRAALPAVLDLSSPKPLTSAPLSGDAVLQRSDAVRLQTTLPVLGKLPPCELSGSMDLSGTLLDPTVDLSAGLYVAGGDPQEWFRLDMDAHLEGGEVEISAAGYDRGERLLLVDGGATTDIASITSWIFEGGPEPQMDAVATWMPDFELRVVPLFVSVDTMAHFVQMPDDLHGKLSGAVRIHGNPEKPEFGGGLQLTEAAVGEVTIAPAVVGLSPAEGGYAVFGTFGFQAPDEDDPDTLQVSTVAVRGTVPFVLDLADFDIEREMAREGLELTVEGDGVPLALARLADPGIRDARGLVRVEGAIDGSLAAPKPDLEVALVDGAFTHVDLKVRFPDIDLDSQLVGTQWQLNSLRLASEPTETSAIARVAGLDPTQLSSAVVNTVEGVLKDTKPLACASEFGLDPGEVLVFGTTQLSGFSLDAVRLNVCTRAAWLSATPEMTLAVGTDLEMRGIWPDLMVAGSTKIASGDMVFDESFFIDQGTLRIDPQLQIERPGYEALVRGEDARDFWWPWDIRVMVDLNNATKLTAVVPMLEGYESVQLQELRLENADVDGVVHVEMHKDTLRAFGEVNVVRGSVEVMNKDFRVERGVLVFSGDYENPVVDLQATRNTGRYGNIGVIIGQTALDPSLEFTSDENLTNTDMLSILLVGVPTDQLGGGNGDLLTVVSLMAEGVITEQAEGIAGGLFDSFQVSTTGDAITDESGQISGEQTDVTATFGKNLGNRLYLEVEWDAVKDDDEVSQWDITLEFIIARRLQAEFTKTAEDGQAGADLLYTWKF